MYRRPFLSVVTRCYKRPLMLARNRASLFAQADPDYEQVFLVDNEGRGVHEANKALATVPVRGKYVLVLDDDDMLTDDNAIAILKEAAADAPDMVVFRAHHDWLGILPSGAVFEQKRPIIAHIGSCDFITRRDVWERHIEAFGTPKCGDYHFLESIWTEQPEVVWLHDVLASVQRISEGAPA